jgi:hypothetical protein
VSLDKIGDLSFVENGDHRASVARYQGGGWVNAEVTGFRGPRVPGAASEPRASASAPSEVLQAPAPRSGQEPNRPWYQLPIYEPPLSAG